MSPIVCTNAEADSVRVRIISTSESLTNDTRCASSSAIPDFETGEVTVTTTEADRWPVCARRALDRLIVKCSKVLSAFSTVLVTVGNVLLLPGVSACVGGAIFGPCAVQAAGSVAVAVGNWLKDAVDSAVARAAV